MIQVAVRGPVNFTCTTYNHYNSVQAVFEAFHVRGRINIHEFRYDFFNVANQRVLLYIQNTPENKLLVDTLCVDENRKFCGMFDGRWFGSGKAPPFGWQSLSPTCHPSFSAEKARLLAESRKAVLLREEAESVEEGLQRVFDTAVSTHGGYKVRLALAALDAEKANVQF